MPRLLVEFIADDAVNLESKTETVSALQSQHIRSNFEISYEKTLQPLQIHKESAWRKPYEILLIGRRPPQSSNCGNESDRCSTTADTPRKRRVIISVPDVHSRKPCLKDLVEPMLRTNHNYRALEVFARHLMSWWWSWGDECLKFNWDGCWRKINNDEQTTE